jgi:hypothetical protein
MQLVVNLHHMSESLEDGGLSAEMDNGIRVQSWAVLQDLLTLGRI